LSEKEVNIFRDTISEQMLGPGSNKDFLSKDIENEVINQYPLVRYYTGIIFPEKSMNTQGDLDNESLESDSQDEGLYFEDTEIESGNITDEKSEIREDKKNESSLSNHFFPSNIGITFCIPDSEKSVRVVFSFSLYEQAKSTDVKLKTSQQIYQVLTGDEYGFPLKDILLYESIDEYQGRLSLKRNLKGKMVGGYTEEFAIYRDWYNSSEKDLKSIIYPAYKHLEELISTNLWRRKPYDFKVEIDTDKEIFSPRQFIDFPHAGYTIKIIKKEKKKFVKIQLVNLFPALGSDSYSNTKEVLNQQCLFQSSIKIHCDKFLEYKSYNPSRKSFDSEHDKLEFLYRDMNHFSIGHNCATEWDPIDKPTEVKTCFIPTYNLKSTKTNIDNLVDISLFDISIWGKPKEVVIGLLSEFVDAYGDWINNQKTFKEYEIPSEIISNLDTTLLRLEEGVTLLTENDDLFQCFQLANTAMLIQFSLKGDFFKELQSQEDLSVPPLEIQKNIGLRPFQLAFLLMSIESLINKDSMYRNNYVDLIWFPTGGGKTEAYLAVAALNIIWRRVANENYDGVSVIMRYTLRLLTAQQFERAGKLITVLEFMRQKFPKLLKSSEISIGLWIGGSSTPNNLETSKEVLTQIKKNGESANQFQVDKCPWCGDKLIQKHDHSYVYAFDVRDRKKDINIKCLNNNCHFSKSSIPVKVVDDVLYSSPPTLLFATVDKFATLSWVEDGHKFFNSLGDDTSLAPDLIIQDELHLLTGPLGSIVGIFESVVEELCTKNGVKPKIIASTATTRNTSEQVKQLFGNRNVNIFPPPGISYDDSFFAKESNESNRKYLGFMPTGKTGVDSQIHMLKTILLARLRVYEAELEINPYWTIVSYYNSLKDVGRMSNKVGDELQQLLNQIQKRLKHPSDNNFNYYNLSQRTEELTSRITSAKIKNTLAKLESDFAFFDSDKGNLIVDSSKVIDLTLATNMLSVGIDIERLNVMQINGIPRDTAEYIQASSRVGRKDKGLVVSIFDSNKARDKSFFEHFMSFHQSLYKSIEPLSITPFTENTIKKMATSLLVSYVRHKKNLNKNNSIQYFEISMADDLIDVLDKRFPNNQSITYFKDKIYELARDWIEKIEQENPFKYYVNSSDAILSKPNQAIESDNIWMTMQSMRDVDTNSMIQIELTNNNE